MRNRLRHRQERRVLRALEGQGCELCAAAVHRHHLRHDREGAGRQDPAAQHRLRPQRKCRRRRVQVELPARRHLLGRVGRDPASHRQEGRRLGQVQGQEDRPRLPRQPVWQGADSRRSPSVRSCTASSCNCCRSRRRASSRSRPGCRSANRARLRDAVGLGRDELHRDQGSAGHRLSARKDVRRVVGRRRAGREGRGRRRQGLQRGGHAARRRAELEGRQGHPGDGARPRARAPARRKKSARCSTCAAR